MRLYIIYDVLVVQSVQLAQKGQSAILEG